MDGENQYKITVRYHSNTLKQKIYLTTEDKYVAEENNVLAVLITNCH